MPFMPPPQQPNRIVYKLDDRARIAHGISNRDSFRALSQLWEGGRLYEVGYGTLNQLDRISPVKNFGTPPMDMAWYFTYDMVEGAAYAWAFGDDRASGQKGRDLKELRSTIYIYRNAGARWDPWGTIAGLPYGSVSWLRPLEGGGYLLGGRFPDSEMHRQDPLAIVRSNGHGKLVVHETEDIDPSQPAFLYGRPSDLLKPQEVLPGVNDQPRWFPNPKVFRIFSGFGTQTIRVPGHLVFLDLHLGRFLTVDSRTGKVERRVDLYDLPEDAALNSGDFEYAVLGAQPRPDGHILIAARSAEAVQQSRTWKPDLAPQAPIRLSFAESFGKSAEDQGDLLEEKQAAADSARAADLREARLRQFPDLVWWDFDPDTGAFRQEPSPEGVPAKFPSCAALRAFSFSFKPDGNLEIEPKVWK